MKNSSWTSRQMEIYLPGNKENTMGSSMKLINSPQFGETIRRLRSETGLTQEQVAAKLQLLNLDITRSQYAQIECGTYNIRPEELCAIKQLFNVSYEMFFKEIEVPGEDFDYTVMIPTKK